MYFGILCIHLTCCGTRGTSAKSSAHTPGNFKIAALVFHFAERLHAVASSRLVEKAQVKASRQQITNLAVHYPQIRSCWNQLLYIQHLPYLARRLYIPNCCISPGNIQNCCISPEVTPRQNCASSPFEPWDIVGAVQST